VFSDDIGFQNEHPLFHMRGYKYTPHCTGQVLKDFPFQSSDILKLQEMAMSITEFGPSQSDNNAKILGILLFTFSLILLSKHELIASHHGSYEFVNRMPGH